MSRSDHNACHLPIETERLILRKPTMADAADIFECYANDLEVTRYVGWPCHKNVDDTKTFLEFSEQEWNRWPAGPLLIYSKLDGLLCGGTGLAFETPVCASTGYILAKDRWGHGFATEALRTIVALANQLDVQRLYAICHTEHIPSSNVLEKCSFEFEGILKSYCVFPNLQPGVPLDVKCYARNSELRA